MASPWSSPPIPFPVEHDPHADDRSSTFSFPSSSYTPRGRTLAAGYLHQYSLGDMEAPNSQHSAIPVVRGRESDLPMVISLPIAVSATLVLNVPLYVLSAVGTNAWGTRAIEYAIGSGSVGTAASLLLIVEKRWSADIVLKWKAAARRAGCSGTRKVELAFLLAYTAALFSSVPRLGYSVHSMYEGALNKGLPVLIEAFWGVVPAVLVVRIVIHWVWLMADGPVSEA